MNRRTRHVAAHRALEEWGEYVAEVRAYGQRSYTPEARLIDEGLDAALVKCRGRQGKPLLPNYHRLKPPAHIQNVDSAVANTPEELAALARLLYVERRKPAEVRAGARLSEYDYADIVTALLVTVGLAIGCAGRG